MLRRRGSSYLLFSSDDPSVPIAYEDTVPSASKRKKITEQGDEKWLEEKVFGIQQLESGFHDNIEESDEVDMGKPHQGAHRQQLHVLEPPPAWVDEDDKEVIVDIAESKGLRKLRKTEGESVITGQEYTDRLRAQFQKLSQQPLWSLPDNERGYSDSESDGDEVPADVTMTTTKHQLTGGLLKIRRMKDANITRRAEAVIKSVEFHPSSNIVLTAGMHKTLSLFQIDGDTNPHLQSVFLKRFPIQTAHFTSTGEEVVMAADRHWYYVYDIVSGKVTRINEIKGHGKELFKKFTVSPDNKLLAFLGKDGYIALVSNKTKQWVGDLKMNGSVTDVAFTPDSSRLFSTGTDGDVYVWDLRSMDCVHRFTDDGCLKGTTLSVSPNGQFIATGSSSGVVNIYDQSCLTLPKPHPLKSVMNLTTCIGHMTFNPSSEILAISSVEKKTAIKLVHLSSMSVYSNWPGSNVSVDYIYSTDFSSDSRYMVLGNAKGKAPLFRLNHFHNNKQ